MLNTTRYRTATFFAATLLCSNVLAQQPVIPGASGFGMYTTAGRGGEIIRVTNLNDSGQGSLRECVKASGPRICVFEVSGAIRLKSNLTIKNENLTIAGQTAPAPGVMLRGASLSVSASNVLVQHLAIRVGDDPDGPPAHVRDTLKVEVPDPIQDIVIDHCSISWSIDENLSTYKYWDNFTVSNSIISEPLDDSIHPKGPHGYGALIDSDDKNSRISFVGNLFAHSDARNPRTNAANFVFVNNVVYNAGNAAVMLANTGGRTSANSIVGNVFINGKNTTAKPVRLVGLLEGIGDRTLLPGTVLYLKDNLAPDATADPWSIVQNQSPLVQSVLEVFDAPAWPEGLKALPTGNGVVLDHVLKNAGSRPGQRDAVDSRIVDDVRNGTGQIINCVADNGSSRCAKNAGGWPDLAKNQRTLDVPSKPNEDDDGDGYTNVEEWLRAMAAEVEGRSGTEGPSVGSNAPSPPMPPELTD